MGDSEEKLDVEEAIIRLNDALKLQYRSAHQYMLSSGSLFGFEFQALEQMLEHVIMRKQDQIDFLVRARRRS